MNANLLRFIRVYSNSFAVPVTKTAGWKHEAAKTIEPANHMSTLDRDVRSFGGYKRQFRNNRNRDSDAEWHQARTLQCRTVFSAAKARRCLPTCRNSDLGSFEETLVSPVRDRSSVAP